jgi:hypothetical protein
MWIGRDPLANLATACAVGLGVLRDDPVDLRLRGLDRERAHAVCTALITPCGEALHVFDQHAQRGVRRVRRLPVQVQARLDAGRHQHGQVSLRGDVLGREREERRDRLQ